VGLWVTEKYMRPESNWVEQTAATRIPQCHQSRDEPNVLKTTRADPSEAHHVKPHEKPAPTALSNHNQPPRVRRRKRTRRGTAKTEKKWKTRNKKRTPRTAWNRRAGHLVRTQKRAVGHSHSERRSSWAKTNFKRSRDTAPCEEPFARARTAGRRSHFPRPAPQARTVPVAEARISSQKPRSARYRTVVWRKVRKKAVICRCRRKGAAGQAVSLPTPRAHTCSVCSERSSSHRSELDERSVPANAPIEMKKPTFFLHGVRR